VRNAIADGAVDDPTAVGVLESLSRDEDDEDAERSVPELID
jgi:hypothetical protein